MKLKTILESINIIEDAQNNGYDIIDYVIDYDIIYKYSKETFSSKENFKNWVEKVKYEIAKIIKDHFIILEEKENYGNFVYTGCLKSKSGKSKKLLYFMLSIPKGRLEEKPILLIPSEISKKRTPIYTDLRNFLKDALNLIE